VEREADADRPLDARYAYRYRPDKGATRIDGVAEGVDIFSGATLLAVAREDFSDPVLCAEARVLLRAALDLCLEGKELRTRQVMLALRRRDR
jgi:DNA repair protein RecO (recombination protein O)